MNKTYFNEDSKGDQKQSPHTKESDQKHRQDTENDVASASCFSSEAERQHQQNQEKKQGKIEKLTNAFSKSFFPPTQNSSGKWRDFQVRGIWTFIMLFSFFLILSMGHLYSALLVILIIFCIYYELIDIPRYKERNSEVKHYYFFSWYIFILGMYYFYVKVIKDKIIYLQQFVIINYLIRYHYFICFMLYIGGFFIFIQSLTKGYYRYQFRQFAYIHIILLIFGMSSSLIVSNIFNGMIWFLIPASLVIVNDISAYIWGRMFGKHQLTPLSPKKTWEGFIGGLFTSVVWCYMITEALFKYDFLLCPIKEIDFIPFSIFNLTCDISELRLSYEFAYDIMYIGKVHWSIKALHFHTFFFGLFASLLAPLGGLFASGFKRAIKIKDFADTIPGHGGLTDRMDCQLLMGFFTYVWLAQFVFYDEKKAMNNLFKKVKGMHYEEQIQLFYYLKDLLRMP